MATLVIACAATDTAPAAPAAPAGAEPPTRVHVLVLNDPSLPQLDEARVQAVLTRARRLVRDVCAREVEFDVADRLDALEFFQRRSEHLTPYQVPEEHAVDPFNTPPEGYRRRVEAALRELGGMEEVRKLMPAGSDVNTVEEAAEVLADAYRRGVESLKRLKAADGDPLLREDNWHRYNLAHWGTLLHSVDWTDEYTLYLSNTLLIDTTITATQPQAAAAGPITNSVGLPASRAAMVAYHAILSDDLSGGNPKLRKMTDKDKDAALAYVVAQAVGVQLLLGRGAEDHPKAGLARPFATLADKSDFTDVRRMKLSPRPASTNRYRASALFKLLLRMDVFIAQERWNAVSLEGTRRREIDLDEASLEQIEARLSLAERKLANSKASRE